MLEAILDDLYYVKPNFVLQISTSVQVTHVRMVLHVTTYRTATRVCVQEVGKAHTVI